VIQRNAFFAHPENLLLTMVSYDRKHIRELGFRRILKARHANIAATEGIRPFKVPDLNFEASDYSELIQWADGTVTDPPILSHLSDEQIQAHIKGDEKVFIPDYPCHTQSVERCVKLVTQAASAVCGAKNRDGFILARLQSRALMPVFEKKSDFTPENRSK